MNVLEIAIAISDRKMTEKEGYRRLREMGYTPDKARELIAGAKRARSNKVTKSPQRGK